MLWSYNLEKERWNYISPSIERLCGYSAAEALQRSIEQCFSPRSFRLFKERSAERIERFSAEQATGFMSRDELEIICKDGATVWCEVTSQCIRNEHGELTLTGVARDLKDYPQVEQELRASEKKYRDILDSIEEGYYECDLEGNLIFCNAAACRMYGGSLEEFIGLNYKILYSKSKEVYNVFSQVYTTGQPEKGFSAEMLRKDGTTMHIEISITLMRDSNGEKCGFRGVARNVTERFLLQQQLEYQSMHDQLTGLYNRHYFEEELRRLSKSRDYPISMIAADLNGLKLINDTMGHEQGDRLLIAAGEALQNSLRGSDVLARVGGDEFAAILLNTDEAIADKVINRIKKNVKKIGEEKPDIYLSLSLGAATAVSGDISFTELFKQADDRMYRDKFSPSVGARNKIVKSLLSSLSKRDYIADGHGKRLTLLCRKVAGNLGLSARQQANLSLLAQVHDLGKVGVPDKILFKEGPLTDDEWMIVQQHPEKGYRIAMSSNHLSGVASLILKHHERWDGRGYPQLLKGREIPVECRIFAVADAYDMMTNIRPYSEAKSKEEAIEEIQHCSGTQFDPEIVEAFIASIRDTN